MNNGIRQRLGKFSISLFLMETAAEDCLCLFATVCIIRCECNYATREFEYVALSPHFDETILGQAAPEYTGIMETRDGKAHFLEWRRR